MAEREAKDRDVCKAPVAQRANEVTLARSRLHEGEETRYTQCWLNGCFGSACVLKCRIKDGKLVSVEPDDTIHAGSAREDIEEDIQKGLLQLRSCPMGHSWAADLYSKTRITRPLKRVGERGEGRFEEISWEEAADLVAEKLTYVKETYGPYSVIQSNQIVMDCCEFELAPWVGAGVAGWGNISFAGPDAAAKYWMGFDFDGLIKEPWLWGSMHQDPMDFFNSKLIILWGWNALARDFQIDPYYMKLARERGTKIICVDPVYNWTAETLADQWIPIRPSTDLALLLGLAYVLITEDLCDHEFMDTWIEPEGLAKLTAYLSGEEDGQKKSPEWAEGICGVPAQTIYSLARLYAETKPCSLRYAVSCGRQHRGEYGSAMAIILQALTGNSMIPGGHSGSLDFPSITPFPAVPLPNMMHMGRIPGSYQAPTLINGPKWADAVVLHEKLESGEMSLDEYNRAIGNAPGNPAPNIQFLLFESHHINNFADVNTRIEAMRKVEFSMGFHYSFEQVTPRYEDLVLPALFPFETTDDYFVRLSIPMSPFQLPHGGAVNYLDYHQKIVDPPGDIRSREWFWIQVAKRLGFADQYNPRLKDVPVETWDENALKVHEDAWNTFVSNPDCQAVYGGPLPTWEEFLKKPIIRVPVNDPHYSFKEEAESGRSPFHTPSGKIEIDSSELASADLSKTKYCGHLDSLPRWEVSYMEGPALDSFFHERAREYPLVMVTPVSQYRQHSLHDNNPLLDGECYRHALWLSVEDARERGISDNDLIRVYNELGEAWVPAYVTNRVTPGTTVLYHGSWYTPNDTKNSRMPDGVDKRGACNMFTSMEFGEHNIGALITTALVQAEKL
jgi:anaerobic dimethyl sulfoxide reductase subunit A